MVNRVATDNRNPRYVMVYDVRKAYLYATAARDIYIELPAEDSEYGSGDSVGKLNLCFHGTRDAALNWQDTLSKHLVENGFTRGIGFLSVFWHETQDIWTLVHGDNCCSAGSPEDLKWQEDTRTK